MSELFLPSRIPVKLFLLFGGDFEMQMEELAISYRKYRNALKVLTLVLIISAGFGIFYWQVTAAKAEVVETWGMADAKEININPKVSGRVVKLFVEEGDRVTQGQLLAKIDSDSQEPQQRAAQANLAAKDEARYRELLTAEAIPAQTYDAYRSKLEDAQAVLAAAQAEVASAQANLLKNDENKALELQDTADNWIYFKISETELKNFSLGDAVTLEGRDGSTQIFGTVESIRRKADFATQKATSERGDPDIIAFNVKIRTDNPNVWPGMRFRILR